MADPLREYRIAFQKVTDGKPVVDVNRQGERSKLGGTPDWDQTDETPECPMCAQEMTFVGQIDSIEHDSKTNPHRIYCLSKDSVIHGVSAEHRPLFDGPASAGYVILR